MVYEEPAILSELEGADVIDIGAGRHHSAAVVRSERDGGTVWSWGNNNAGKLGHGTLDQSPPSRYVHTHDDEEHGLAAVATAVELQCAAEYHK